MEVLTLGALSDNYMYLLVDKTSKVCAAVDPVDADKILATVKQHGFHLTTVLTTHHHSDHAGGNQSLVEKWKTQTGSALVVYGGSKSIAAVTNPVGHGHKFTLGDNLHVHCLATPCHTQDHICYHVVHGDDAQHGVVFTGDTLFLGGCGRFFEGTPDQMYKGLIEVLGNLPVKTKVYCGHEYTAKNLEFASTIEPDNKQLKQRCDVVKQTRSINQPTVPGTIEEELATNPFMRVNQPSVQALVKSSDPVETMRIIRAKKNAF